MKSRRFDGGDLRRTLIGMVTDPVVCSRVAATWKDDMFRQRWANLVGGWAVKYFRKYGAPPDGRIKDIFERWADKTSADGDTVEAVEKFLRALSDEHEAGPPQAADYVLDVAGRHLNEARLRQVIEDATADLDRGKVDDAHGRLTGVSRVELGVGAVVDPAEDWDAWERAFDNERRRPLVTYPGALGKFIGDAMGRDCLFAFMSPDKVGKSMWLLDLAYRAVRQRRRTAFFDVGDQCQDDVMVRLGQRTTRRPEHTATLNVPVGFGKDRQPEVESQKLEGLSAGEAHRAFKRAVRDEDLFRLSCHPNSSIGAAGISSLLQDWGREGWTVDVCVIDYADILAPPGGVRETLDQIDETWKRLRRMSQEMHCLVVTATQSSAAAYAEKQRTLSRRHFSGRKTKLAHVNGMLGLNATPAEKEKGITRINWVVRRRGAFSETACVHVAGCLAVASPAMKSTF